MRMRDRQGCSIIHSPLPFIRSATSFSLSSPLPRHTDYALFLYPRRRGRNHTLSFEHERQGRKTTTRTTDHCMCLRAFVSFCIHVHFFFLTRKGDLPSDTFMYICIFKMSFGRVDEGVRFHASRSHLPVCFCLVWAHVNIKAFTLC